jgi:MFS family permease
MLTAERRTGSPPVPVTNGTLNALGKVHDDQDSDHGDGPGTEKHPLTGPEDAGAGDKGGISDLPRILCLTSTNFVYGAITSTMALIALPWEAKHLFPEFSAVALGAFLGINGVSQLVCPVAGTITDAWNSRLGRRRPFVILGTCIAFVGAAIMKWTSINYMPSFFPPALLFALVGLNVLYSAQQALVPDLVATRAQGIASGCIAMHLLTGALTGFLYVEQTRNEDFHVVYDLYFVELVVSCVLVCSVAAEHNRNPDAGWFGYITGGTVSTQTLVKGLRISKKDAPDFFYVAVSRTWYYIGVSCQAFMAFFLRDCLGTEDDSEQREQVSVIVLLGQLTAASIALPVSKLSDKIGRKKPIYIACAVMTSTYIGFLTSPKFPTREEQLTSIYVWAAIYGLGNGCYLAVDYALALDCLPWERARSRSGVVLTIYSSQTPLYDNI